MGLTELPEVAEGEPLAVEAELRAVALEEPLEVAAGMLAVAQAELQYWHPLDGAS